MNKFQIVMVLVVFFLDTFISQISWATIITAECPTGGIISPDKTSPVETVTLQIKAVRDGPVTVTRSETNKDGTTMEESHVIKPDNLRGNMTIGELIQKMRNIIE